MADTLSFDALDRLGRALQAAALGGGCLAGETDITAITVTTVEGVDAVPAFKVEVEYAPAVAPPPLTVWIEANGGTAFNRVRG